MADEPDDQAEAYTVIKDPTHPEASGVTGVVPPPEGRFKPGESGNPGGRPKGSYSIRAVKRRLLAANPNEFGEGEGAVASADAIFKTLAKMRAGQLDPDTGLRLIDAEIRLIHEVEGKPQERVEHSGGQTRRIQVHKSEPPQ